jgi:hypothetical protein
MFAENPYAHNSRSESRKSKPKQVFSLLTKTDQMAIVSNEKRFDTWGCSLMRERSV